MTNSRKPPTKSSSKGFSIVELMLTVVINLFVFLVMGQLFMEVGRMQTDLSEQKKNEESAMTLAFYLRSILSQAVEVDAVTAPIPSGCCAGRGRIRSYDSSTLPTSSVANVETIGVFWREWGEAPITAARDDLKATAIFYQVPTADTSGMLYIDLGPTFPLAASEDDISVDGLVGLKVETIRPESGDTGPIASLRIHYTVRRYKAATSDWKWCRPADMQAVDACKTQDAYNDLQRSIDIHFRNNILGPARFLQTGYERVFDQLYFFRTMTPVRL